MTDPTPAEVIALKACPCSAEVVTDIDVPVGAWGWIDIIAAEHGGPHRRIETPQDAETIVYWQDEQPAAIVLNLRDQFNYSIQYRFDLRRIPQPPAADAGEVRTYREGVASEWQSIESAPSDETSVDLWVQSEGFGWRVPNAWRHPDDMVWITGEANYGEPGPCLGPMDCATHWRPIPEPPAAAIRKLGS